VIKETIIIFRNKKTKILKLGLLGAFRFLKTLKPGLFKSDFYSPDMGT